MKIANLSLAILSLLTLNLAYAATPGAYVGAGVGKTQLELPGMNHYSKETDGPGGRAYAGYNFNEYLGIEAGIAHYAKAKYLGTATYTGSSLEYSMNAIDLVAKTYLPFAEKRFNIFALGGVAAVNQSTQANNGGIPFIDDFIPTGHTSKKRSKIRPIYGIGIGYDIPKSNISTSVELTRIQGLGEVRSNPNAMPPANMVAVNFTYNFGS